MHYVGGCSQRVLASVTVLVLCLTAWAATARAEFGSEGKVVAVLGGTSAARSVAIARDGKIVAAGATNINGHFDFYAYRFTRQGQADGGFGTGGPSVIAQGQDQNARAVLALPNRKVLVAGRTDGLVADRGQVVRLRRNGTLDPGFSGDGIALVNHPDGVAITDMARQPDGKIVVVGSAGAKMLVARLRANGTLDKGFAKNGIRVATIDDQASASAVAIQKDGRIVVVGQTAPGGMSLGRAAVIRLRANGKFDKSFSGDGRKAIKFPDASELEDVVTRGKRIIAAGETASVAIRRPILVALKKNGAFDKKFAGKGKRAYSFGARTAALAIAFQGKKLVIGGRRDDPVSDFFVARFTAKGKLDKSFSNKGWRATDFGFGDVAQALAVQRDKKIVLAGVADDDLALARYRKNGALDK